MIHIKRRFALVPPWFRRPIEYNVGVVESPFLWHWVILGALGLAVHVRLVWLVWLRGGSWLQRLLVLVPVVTPVSGWWCGMRWLPIAWVLCWGSYALMRWGVA